MCSALTSSHPCFALFTRPLSIKARARARGSAVRGGIQPIQEGLGNEDRFLTADPDWFLHTLYTEPNRHWRLR